MENNQISYTGRDIVSLRHEILSDIRNKNPEWNDFNDSDLSIILINVLSGAVDMLNYYVDNQALECNLLTARQPKSIRGLLESYNVKLPSVVSSEGYVTVEAIDEESPIREGIDFILPAYTEVYSRVYDLTFCTTESVTFNHSDKEKIVKIIQGTHKQITVKPSEIEMNEYKIFLPDLSVPINSVSVTTKSNNWTKVEDAFLELIGGKVYSVHADYKGRTYILLSYDWRKYVTDDADTFLDIDYVISLGEVGNVPVNCINFLRNRVYDENGRDISEYLIINNPEPTSGALDSPNYQIMKAHGRNHIKTMGTYVTTRDYKAAVEVDPRIVDSYTVSILEDPKRVQSPCLVRSWVITTDLDDTSSINLKELANKIKDNGIAGTNVEIMPAKLIVFDIVADLVINANEYQKSIIYDKVRNTLLSLFAPSNLELGTKVDKYILESTILKCDDAIVTAEVTKPTTDIVCDVTESVRLRDVILNIKDYKEEYYKSINPNDATNYVEYNPNYNNGQNI